MKKNNKTYDKLSTDISKELSPNMKVLELACGTGQLSFRLCKKVKQWIATDYSANMIKEAKKNGHESNISFRVADATNLNYKENEFDAVVIANALHIMPEPEKALAEIYRVLKPGGILFAPTFVYERGYKKTKIWLMEKAGFHTFYKWRRKEYCAFVKKYNFKIETSELTMGDPLPECLLIARK